ITQMIEKGGYTRANAMMTMLRGAPYVAAPAIAAPLLSAIGIIPVLVIDTASYVLAVAAVFAVTLPPNPVRDRVTKAASGFRQDIGMGLRYIARRPPLVG